MTSFQSKPCKSLAVFFMLISAMLSSCSSKSTSSESGDKAGMIYHVSKAGSDDNSGLKNRPFLTIAKAADLAMPGDTIIVHEGEYRERIDPPRGGSSDDKRITYQAADNEKVVLLGSENIKGWQSLKNDVWKVEIPNEFFGDYNPYQVKIAGDWFIDNGRDHHTGAVYVNGDWLWEASRLDLLLGVDTDADASLARAREKSSGNLFNIKHFSIGETQVFQAQDANDSRGTERVVVDSGENLVGNIKNGSWQRFNDVDLSLDAEFIRIYAGASNKESNGGLVELRMGSPSGKRIASVVIRPTASWGDLQVFRSAISKESGVHDLFLVYTSPSDKDILEIIHKRAKEDKKLEGKTLWYSEVGAETTTIYAQFPNVLPNEQGIEVNAREAIFYPSKPGIDYITVRGFEMRNAASNWAPPTAEQVAAVGTHWSKGWIIEDNDISYARSACMSLGKYGDQYDNTSANSATGYVVTIKRALENGWSKDNIGHHVVNRNTISHCEQAGIVGSLGAAFSRITNNTIHDIHQQKLYNGYEMAGVKFHAPLDTEISGNRIYNTHRGLWLDWMTQGTRVSRNVFYNNDRQDIWLEVNHGPALIDNNLLLSTTAIEDWSQGTAFVHNLVAGNVRARPVPERSTPYHYPHSTKIKDITNIQGGDNRYYNNIFFASDLSSYTSGRENLQSDNVFIATELVISPSNEELIFSEDIKKRIFAKRAKLIVSDSLGVTGVSGLPYKDVDGSVLELDKDFFNSARNRDAIYPGPFGSLPDRISLK